MQVDEVAGGRTGLEKYLEEWKVGSASCSSIGNYRQVPNSGVS